MTGTVRSGSATLLEASLLASKPRSCSLFNLEVEKAKMCIMLLFSRIVFTNSCNSATTVTIDSNWVLDQVRLLSRFE